MQSLKSITDDEIRCATIVELKDRDTNELICTWTRDGVTVVPKENSTDNEHRLQIGIDVDSDEIQTMIESIESAFGSPPRWPRREEELWRYYDKEEEFLDEFSDVPWVASKLLGDDWHPDPSCNDAVRQQRQYFIEQDELNYLVFHGAAIHHDRSNRRFSSAQIVLKSSTRNVTIRVHGVGRGLVAEMQNDQPTRG